MDLFVINRYRDSDDEDNPEDRESANLIKLKQKIEERKRNAVKKTTDEIVLRPPVKSEDKQETPERAIADTVEDTETLKEKPEQTKKDKPSAEFKVLGVKEFQHKVTVKRILPHWLSNPIEVSTNLQNLNCKVEDQDWLHSTLKSVLLSEGVTDLFPVQQLVVPSILRSHKLPPPFWPNDVCVSAPTGSGKTLSFVLPVVQILMDQVGHCIRALVVLPVQELATQVSKVFKKYTARTSLKVALLSGSTPLRQEQKQLVRYTESQGWICETDIIVCTAGRLVEHLQNTQGFSLKHLKFLVIDEADRIMDHIQNDWLYHLDRSIKLDNELMTGKDNSLSWRSLTEQRQPPHKLLFSATLSQDPEKVEQWSLFQPRLFSAAPKSKYEDDTQSIKKYTTPDELQEQFVVCEAEVKPLILYHLFVEKQWNKVLCFTNSSQTAHRLAVLLTTWSEGRVRVAELSAALDRTKREAVLKKFHQAEIDVLIGTDALARGIDIPECDYVVSYDPPHNIKTYIHRVGRTGRAGRRGAAVTILLGNQVNMFKETLQWEKKDDLPKVEIPDDIYERLSSSYERAINSTKHAIQQEVTSQVKKSVALKRGTKKSRPMKRKLSDSKE
ncbi:hypothetical protein JYU34_003756 [Plutella xylostella]|uniref:ATP-dependent RNA helicase n=1 Tax=Plutella xylostella TaxID=51655 RepID=A0ABQ7R0X1_PLUXY|nr:hypothetical protein JYU34_003756 [Plutella xylostella]